MYMIFNGSVTLSLDKKDVNEYFRLYQSNYFGDYQIIFDYRSSECYKSSIDSPTYCFCLGKKTFLDLCKIYPESKAIFEDRAILRRKEFRRIKRQFHAEADIPMPRTNAENKKIMKQDILTVDDGLPYIDEDGNEVRKPTSKFNTYTYKGVTELDENGNEIEEQPKFLTNPNYYFMKPQTKFDSYGLSDLSDDEVMTRKEEAKTAKVASNKTFRNLLALEH